MKLPKSLTTVTKFSKILAVVIFFTFLFTAFLAGMKYQEMNTLFMESKKTILPISTPSPTPDPTANWKIITIIKDGYSFKYPSDWNLFISGDEEFTTLGDDVQSITLLSPEDSPKEGLHFYVSENPKGLSLEEFSKTVWNIDTTNSKPIQVDGVYGLLTGSNLATIVVKNGQKVYQIWNNINFDYRSTLKPFSGIAGQILSTFQFTE